MSRSQPTCASTRAPTGEIPLAPDSFALASNRDPRRPLGSQVEQPEKEPGGLTSEPNGSRDSHLASANGVVERIPEARKERGKGVEGRGRADGCHRRPSSSLA